MAAEGSPPGRASREPARRLFFALWPDEPMRQAMAQAVREAVRARRGSDPGCGGRPVPAANLHVTLAFLGATAERRLPELTAAARAVAQEQAGEPLELSFDHLEYWRAAQLLCAAPAEAPQPTAALAGRLQTRLAAGGFASDLKSLRSAGVDTTKPFRPHVTLARKVRRPPSALQIQPVTWGFTDFVLVDSRTLPEGSVYTVVARFSFAR